MKIGKFTAILASTLLCTLSPSPQAFAGTIWLVSPETRDTSHKTSTLILVGQSQILVGDDQAMGSWSNVTSTPGAQFGIIGALINTGRESRQEKIQNALVSPIINSLSDVNIDNLALKATASALQQISWLNSGALSGTKDDSVAGENSFMSGNSGDQAVFIHYVYFFDPAFEAFHTKILIEIARKTVPAGGKPEDRFKQRNLAYRQTVDISVPLPGVKKNNDAANASGWAANNGDLARKAIQSAFESAAIYLPRVLNMTAADLAALYDRKLPKMKYDGDWGQKIEDSNDRTVMWAERFVIIPKIG